MNGAPGGSRQSEKVPPPAEGTPHRPSSLRAPQQQPAITTVIFPQHEEAGPSSQVRHFVYIHEELSNLIQLTQLDFVLVTPQILSLAFCEKIILNQHAEYGSFVFATRSGLIFRKSA